MKIGDSITVQQWGDKKNLKGIVTKIIGNVIYFK